MAITTTWRGIFTDAEVNRLHAEAFGPRVDAEDRYWWRLVGAHSLGWVTARAAGDDTSTPTGLLGFVNVIWDGLVHAWIQDVMVAEAARRHGIGRQLVRAAADGTRDAGCAWLHVDFEDRLTPFYLQACGFVPTTAGLLEL